MSRIDALSPDDAWAVGVTPQNKTLAKHWDGTRWRTVKTPDVAVGDALTKVEEISPTDVWAAGQVTVGTPGAFLEHWNGHAWTVVDSDIPASSSAFSAISAASSNDVWISGYDGSQGFLDHWDGSAWTQVSNPGGARPEAELTGVTAFSGTDAWSVGSWYRCAGGHYCYHKRIIQHWDGHAWKTYDRP